MTTLLQIEGKQLTLGEFESLLTQAGFVQVQVLASFGYYELVTAYRP